MRMLYKPGFNPLSVELHRPMPREGDEPYRAFMRAPLSFSNQATTLVFDRHELMQPLGGACPELAQVNDNIANQYLARLDKNDVVTGVTQKIIELLPSGDCSREKVAEALCMSPATLQVRLAKRGTSFLQLMDDTRRSWLATTCSSRHAPSPRSRSSSVLPAPAISLVPSSDGPENRPRNSGRGGRSRSVAVTESSRHANRAHLLSPDLRRFPGG